MNMIEKLKSGLFVISRDIQKIKKDRSMSIDDRVEALSKLKTKAEITEGDLRDELIQERKEAIIFEAEQAKENATIKLKAVNAEKQLSSELCLKANNKIAELVDVLEDIQAMQYGTHITPADFREAFRHAAKTDKVKLLAGAPGRQFGEQVNKLECDFKRDSMLAEESAEKAKSNLKAAKLNAEKIAIEELDGIDVVTVEK